MKSHVSQQLSRLFVKLAEFSFVNEKKVVWTL